MISKRVKPVIKGRNLDLGSKALGDSPHIIQVHITSSLSVFPSVRWKSRNKDSVFSDIIINNNNIMPAQKSMILN